MKYKNYLKYYLATFDLKKCHLWETQYVLQNCRLVSGSLLFFSSPDGLGEMAAALVRYIHILSSTALFIDSLDYIRAQGYNGEGSLIYLFFAFALAYRRTDRQTDRERGGYCSLSPKSLRYYCQTRPRQYQQIPIDFRNSRCASKQRSGPDSVRDSPFQTSTARCVIRRCQNINISNNKRYWVCNVAVQNTLFLSHICFKTSLQFRYVLIFY